MRYNVPVPILSKMYGCLSNNKFDSKVLLHWLIWWGIKKIPLLPTHSNKIWHIYLYKHMQYLLLLLCVHIYSGTRSGSMRIRTHLNLYYSSVVDPEIFLSDPEGQLITEPDPIETFVWPIKNMLPNRYW
jgi:hypothetical protein